MLLRSFDDNFFGDVVELWLRNGANPYVHFDWELKPFFSLDFSGTISPKDGSSMLCMPDIINAIFIVLLGIGQLTPIEDDPPSLRTLVRWCCPDNYQILLDLIDDGTGHGGQDPIIK